MKSCEDEIHSIRREHDDERQTMQMDMRRKEATIALQTREMADLQTKLADVSQKLVGAEESSRTSVQDKERIESL